MEKNNVMSRDKKFPVLIKASSSDIKTDYNNILTMSLTITVAGLCT